MKKILLMLLVVGVAFTTGCGKKKEEEKPKDNKDNVQEDAPIIETTPENDLNLTDEDIAKIANSMETTRLSDNKAEIKVTYTNGSDKDFKVTKIKITASKDKTEFFSTIKEFNDVVKPGETKSYKIEANITLEKLHADNVDLLWEMVE